MSGIFLDDIPNPFDLETLFQTLHLQENTRHGEKVRTMVEEARKVAKPKAFYCEAYIEEKGEGYVVIQGVRLTSHILRVNLDEVYRTFPYVATCGLELEEWSKSYEDILEKFWADAIKEHALRSAFRDLGETLRERSGIKELSRMNPGSLADWPLSQQGPLFQILGEGPRRIGVQLTDSYLMLPIKSVSGIYFPATVSYENCMLCAREKCPGRRAAYDPHLLETRYPQGRQRK